MGSGGQIAFRGKHDHIPLGALSPRSEGRGRFASRQPFLAKLFKLRRRNPRRQRRCDRTQCCPRPGGCLCGGTIGRGGDQVYNFALYALLLPCGPASYRRRAHLAWHRRLLRLSSSRHPDHCGWPGDIDADRGPAATPELGFIPVGPIHPSIRADSSVDRQWVASSVLSARAMVASSRRTRTTARGPRPSALWTMPSAKATCVVSSARLCTTRAVVRRSPRWSSVIRTATARSSRRLSPSRACTPASSSTPGRRPP